MERFVPHFQGRPWPSGMPALHVYVLPRPGVDDGVLSLARSCVLLTEGYPVDPQISATGDDAGLLHATLEMLADAPANEYDEPAIQQLVEALEAELADIAPFTTEVGPPHREHRGGASSTCGRRRSSKWCVGQHVRGLGRCGARPHSSTRAAGGTSRSATPTTPPPLTGSTRACGTRSPHGGRRCMWIVYTWFP